MTEGVKLSAKTLDDLAIISALVQDMTVKRSDIAFLAKNRRFALTGNRFCWERETKKKFFGKAKIHQRVRAGLRIELVKKAQYQNLDTTDEDHILSLLGITGSCDDAGIVIAIYLAFSGNMTIRLDVDDLDIYLDDLSSPWTTDLKPKHDVKE